MHTSLFDPVRETARHDRVARGPRLRFAPGVIAGAALFVASTVHGPFGMAGAALAQTAPPVALQVPSIVTNGEAVVRRPADQAFVVASVETRARSPLDAQRQNAERMAAVRQKVAAAGLASDAVRTLGYSIRQDVDIVEGRRVPRDYVARNALEIRVDAVERTGEIIDTVVQAGATSIGGVRFDLKDRAAAEREALRLAVVDARGRADAAAAGAGQAVDRILRIDDTRGPIPYPRPEMAMMRAAAADQAVETPVEPGMIELRANVVLTVSIR